MKKNNSPQKRKLTSKPKSKKKPVKPRSGIPFKPPSNQIRLGTNHRRRKKPMGLVQIEHHNQLLVNEPIIRKKSTKDLTSLAEKITSLNLFTKHEKLARSEIEKEHPVVISVKTEDVESEDFRSGLDLVMLVDVSGSMRGEKIKLVKDTLLFIIDELTENDRLSIIAFNAQVRYLSCFVQMTDVGKNKLRSIVNQHLKASGNTNLGRAIIETYGFLTRRNEINDSTSVFLLSDGCDTCGQTFNSLTFHLNNGHQQMKQKNMNYSFHSFGYGSDHDEKILSLISDTSNGNFYYIKQLSYIDECFIDCFGLLLSVYGRDTKVELHLTNGIKFVKTETEGFEKKTDRAAVIEVGEIATGQDYTYLGFISFNTNKLDLSKPSLKFGELELEFKCQGKSIFKTLEFEIDLVDETSQKGEIIALVPEEVEKAQAKKVLEQAREKLKKGDIQASKNIVMNYNKRLQSSSSLGITFKSKMAKNVAFTNIQSDKDFVQVHRKMRKKKEINPEYANFRADNMVQKKMKKRKRVKDAQIKMK